MMSLRSGPLAREGMKVMDACSERILSVRIDDSSEILQSPGLEADDSGKAPTNQTRKHCSF